MAIPLSYNRPCTAMIGSALSALWVDFKMVEARVLAGDVHSPQGALYKTGNESADCVSKLGLRMRPSPFRHERDLSAWQIQICKAAVMLGARNTAPAS
eukprot:8120480-Pyramimonas_sp.AAC.1